MIRFYSNPWINIQTTDIFHLYTNGLFLWELRYDEVLIDINNKFQFQSIKRTHLLSHIDLLYLLEFAIRRKLFISYTPNGTKATLMLTRMYIQYLMHEISEMSTLSQCMYRTVRNVLCQCECQCRFEWLLHNQFSLHLFDVQNEWNQWL